MMDLKEVSPLSHVVHGCSKTHEGISLGHKASNKVPMTLGLHKEDNPPKNHIVDGVVMVISTHRII